MSVNGPVTGPALLELLSRPAPEVAPWLLGSLFGHRTAEGSVVLRITEVEAYGGPDGSDLPDPGAHTWPGGPNIEALRAVRPRHVCAPGSGRSEPSGPP